MKIQNLIRTSLQIGIGYLALSFLISLLMVNGLEKELKSED